jgi:NTE family protein
VLAAFAVLLSGCVTLDKAPAPAPAATPTVATRTPPKLVLALGGGAARGFAHIGVIKTLESHGIVPDMVIGTSAGSVVGALYAAGYSGYELQKQAMKLEESSITDWSLPDRGVFKGEALQKFINDSVRQLPMERLKKPFAAVATDLHSGEAVVFRSGNTGMAVRASSSVPGVFQPVGINGREYVDGGLVSPIPVRAARAMGGEVVIAVDISSKPKAGKVGGTLDVLLQTVAIMGTHLGQEELKEADVVIRPDIPSIGATDFKSRNDAILEGERAAQAALPQIRAKLGLK